jgi:hypothetical protein
MASAAFSLGDRVADLTVLGSNAPYRIQRADRDCEISPLLLGHAGIAPHAPAQCRAGLDGRHSGVGRSARLAKSSVPPPSRLAEVAGPVCGPLSILVFHQTKGIYGS